MPLVIALGIGALCGYGIQNQEPARINAGIEQLDGIPAHLLDADLSGYVPSLPLDPGAMYHEGIVPAVLRFEETPFAIPYSAHPILTCVDVPLQNVRYFRNSGGPTFLM